MSVIQPKRPAGSGVSSGQGMPGHCVITRYRPAAPVASTVTTAVPSLPGVWLSPDENARYGSFG